MSVHNVWCEQLGKRTKHLSAVLKSFYDFLFNTHNHWEQLKYHKVSEWRTTYLYCITDMKLNTADTSYLYCGQSAWESKSNPCQGSVYTLAEEYGSVRRHVIRPTSGHKRGGRRWVNKLMNSIHVSHLNKPLQPLVALWGRDALNNVLMSTCSWGQCEQLAHWTMSLTSKRPRFVVADVQGAGIQVFMMSFNDIFWMSTVAAIPWEAPGETRRRSRAVLPHLCFLNYDCEVNDCL